MEYTLQDTDILLMSLDEEDSFAPELEEESDADEMPFGEDDEEEEESNSDGDDEEEWDDDEE